MKKGQNYKFLRDYVDTTGAILFKKGKIYTAISDVNLVDECGNIHYFTNQEGNLFVQWNPTDTKEIETTADTLNTEEIDREVEHPVHYTWLKELCGIEVIDITRHMNFNLGNAIKYILRSGRKPIKSESKSDFYAGMIQDLKKAAWYINDEIERLQK